MRKVFVFLAVLFALSSIEVQAQIDVTILNYYYNGTRPSQYFWVVPGPVGYVNPRSSKVTLLYTAAELMAEGAPAGGGKIPAILQYQYTSLYYLSYITNFSIKMSHTTESNIMAGPNTFDDTEVFYRDSWNIPIITSPNRDWQRIDFDTPFEWNGVDNIVVTFCHRSPHVTGVYPNGYLHALWTRYGYPTYPTFPYQYRMRYSYSFATPADFCDIGVWGTGPYNHPMRADMWFEVCNEDPSIYDMTVNPIHFLPGALPVTWSLGRASGSFTATVTISLYLPDGTFVTSQSFPVPINADYQNGTFNLPLTGVAPGFYRVEATFNTKDECANMADHFVNRAVMILEPGMIPCEVWPGDVNNDGVVNYGDRRDLNIYIFEANLRSTWLTGPQRYRVDLEENPLSFYTWETQPGVPWFTPEGCYMDSDGNGVVNNFDYIAVKLNWMKIHDYVPPKNIDEAYPVSFSMDQNFPNPFNPSTTIRYRLPERSEVQLIVTDMLGHEVARLIDSEVQTGSHSIEFNAQSLASGNYMARVVITGMETGTTYSKTMKMMLGK